MSTIRLTFAWVLCGSLLALLSCSQGTDVPGNASVEAQQPPTADFGATTTSGTAPVTTSFIDLSSGAVSWFWEFGDGGVSTLPSPMHTYAAAGTFDVRLTVTGSDGQTATRTRTAFVMTTAAIADATFESQTPGQPPGAPWTTTFGAGHQVLSAAIGGSDNGMPSAGLQWCEISSAGTDPAGTPVGGIEQTIRFPAGRPVLQFDLAFVLGETPMNGANNDFLSVAVADGTTVIVLAQRDTFSPVVGTSTVHGGGITSIDAITADLQQLFPGATETTDFTLTFAIGNGGDGNNPSFGYIDNLRFEQPAPQAVTANFAASMTMINENASVTFTDTSLGNPKAWSWDFGDGSGSTEQNPIHVYTAAGTYTVSLTASAPGSSNTLTMVDLIDVAPAAPCPSVGGFTAVQDPNMLRTVDFTALVPQNVVDFIWDFGDGNMQTTTSTTISHTYATAGTFMVTLDPDDANPTCDPNMDQVTMMVTVENPPDVAFTANPDPAYVDVSVAFNATLNGGSGAVTTFAWDFENDGSNDAFGMSAMNPYGSGGMKTVQLTASGPGGTDVETMMIKIVPTWTQIFGASFANCQDCHVGGQATSFFSTADKDTMHTNVFNIATTGPNTVGGGGCVADVRVVPGSPSTSSLVESVAQLNPCLTAGGPPGGQMTNGNGGPVLSTNQITDLEDWISLGALNN